MEDLSASSAENDDQPSSQITQEALKEITGHWGPGNRHIPRPHKEVVPKLVIK